MKRCFRFLIIVSSLFIFGCTHLDENALAGEDYQRPEEGVDYEFSYKENYLEKRFDLEFKSLSDQVLLLAFDHWPNRVGDLESATRSVYVLMNGEKFYYKDLHNFAFCVGGCPYTIEPGGSLKGLIFFSDFPEGAFLDKDAERVLVFPYYTHPFFKK